MTATSRPTVTSRNGMPIADLETWQREAGPAGGDRQWQDGRSAKELARAWVGGGTGPQDLAALLAGDTRLKGLTIDSAIAEAQTAFDAYAGGVCNHDLLIAGHCDSGPVRIGLEAKADEPFGQTVAEYETRARRDLDAGTPSNALKRVHGLIEDLTSVEAHSHNLGHLRYQLFTAVAGTLAAAKPGEAAIFVVHEFATPQTDPAKCQANRLDLARFVREVFGVAIAGESCWVLGPFGILAPQFKQTPLYLAHLTTTTA
jgi:hypothetical protein